MNILSLFDGISCGRLALERTGIKVDKYFASEIDPYAIKIAKKNFPDTIHIGSVTEVTYEDGYLHQKIDASFFNSWENDIDMIIGGSPCQDLSAAKQGGKGLDGEKSSLFFEYVRLLKEVKPKYFLLENVASMKQESKEKITELLKEIYPESYCIMINSRLVSGQNRKRLYWTNIKWIVQPDDRGILLQDVLEDIGVNDPSWKLLDKKYLNDQTKLRMRDKCLAITATYSRACPRDYFEKSNRNLILGVMQKPRGKNIGGLAYDGEKSPTITSSKFQDNNFIAAQFRRTKLRIHEDQEKVCTLTANMGTGGNNVHILIDPNNEIEYLWRKLTPIECERLQTLPDNWTEGVSNTQRYKAIGNGWTVDVIAHIFSFIK